ncbi:hypothetical protein HDU97_010372 [Phlyctochytrium planicorne]|nr:hypothetical protein HDU97_010372 [Phlyctochytrium planicorne]
MIRKKESELERLEFENKKMEERLQALKEYLAIEKEKRGESTFVWKAGKQQRGSLSKYAGDVLAKKGAKVLNNAYALAH